MTIYTQQRFYFMTLDPVHIGAGGYRLGRVDNTIAREPGTNLPKIPGTSLAGAARSYAALRYGKPDAAGQHNVFQKSIRKLSDDDKQGAKNKCPIIYTFGTATDAGGGQAGTVSIGDAQILFFPVASMAGPIWVSTIDRIKDAWVEGKIKLPKNGETEIVPTDTKENAQVVTSLNWEGKELNLGWLLFACTKGLSIEAPDELKDKDEWMAIKDRVVLTTPKLFSQIVNSNLEVRTSVAINAETGAAEDGALFTYEAIPRATWLWGDVIEDNYAVLNRRLFPVTTKQCKVTITKEGEEETRDYKDNQGEELGATWSRPLDVVNAGFKLIEFLGVGGMGTRGFGRLRTVGSQTINGGAQ